MLKKMTSITAQRFHLNSSGLHPLEFLHRSRYEVLLEIARHIALLKTGQKIHFMASTQKSVAMIKSNQ